MLRKRLFILTATLVVFAFGAGAAMAQSGQLRGTVMFQGADGKPVPAAGAKVDVYRTDVAGAYHTTTNKNGQWVFAGLPFIGTYTISVSMPNARPDFQPEAKAGRDVDYKMTLSPGDGRVLTLEEVKTATVRGGGATGGSSGESASDRAKREELLKKNAEIESANKKTGEINEIIARTFKVGNEALKAKNYEEAIKQYREGIAADPEQPALLTNLSIALRARGVDRYNTGVKTSDQAVQSSGVQDFKDAADAGTKAVEFLKVQPAGATPEETKRHTANTYFALAAKAEALRLVATKVDQKQADAAFTSYEEYMAAETDPVKKKAEQLEAAKLLLDAGQGAKALGEYKKILAVTPDDPDANFGAGMALFQDETDTKTSYQLAANYLQHFVDVAPDTHQFKDEAKGILAELKNTNKVEPVKMPRRPARKP